jgi:hypothetical protein
LWRIPADTHVRIGTLLNNFPPSTRLDRLAGNETLLPDSDSLLSDRQSPASAAANSRGSEAEGSLSDSSLLTILRKRRTPPATINGRRSARRARMRSTTTTASPMATSRTAPRRS